MRASLLGAPLHPHQPECATVLVRTVSSTKYPGPDRTLLCAVRVHVFSSAPISIVQFNIQEVVILEIPRHGASGTPDLTARDRWGGGTNTKTVGWEGAENDTYIIHVQSSTGDKYMRRSPGRRARSDRGRVTTLGSGPASRAARTYAGQYFLRLRAFGPVLKIVRRHSRTTMARCCRAVLDRTPSRTNQRTVRFNLKWGSIARS